VLPAGAFFYDNFVRPVGENLLAPWIVSVGSWTIADGILRGQTNGSSGHASAYVNSDWTDYSVEVHASVPTNGFGWFLGGRLNPATGEYYEVFLYANYDSIGPWKLHLTKHTTWGPNGWDGVNMANQPDVVVPGVGSTNLHALKMTFQGNRILVHFDGVLYMDVRDDNFPSFGTPWPVFRSGGILVGMYATNDYIFTVKDAIVRQLPIATNLMVGMRQNTATNLTLEGSIGEGTKTFAIVSGPTNGVLSEFNPNTGTVTYTPATNYSGHDAFVFTVSDGTLLATGVVSITVRAVTDIPPVILSLKGAGTSNIVITWSAISDQIYRLLYNDDLRSSNWINQPPDITALGPTASVTNTVGTSGRRFYRVLLLP